MERWTLQVSLSKHLFYVYSCLKPQVPAEDRSQRNVLIHVMLTLTGAVACIATPVQEIVSNEVSLTMIQQLISIQQPSSTCEEVLQGWTQLQL